MQDLPTVQNAHGPQQTFGYCLPLCQGQWALTLEQFGQGLARILTHHIIQMLTPATGMDLRERPPRNPPQKPFLRQ